LRLLHSLRVAYRDALGPGGIAFAAPQVAFVGALVAAYGIALIVGGRATDQVAPTIGLALVIALGAALAGIALAYLPDVGQLSSGGRPGGSWVRIVGEVLIAVGVVALAAYLWRIGEVPLFMASAEQGRVDAAERGGAALRVLSLLALPGCWLLVADAVSTSRRKIVGAALIVIGVAGLQLLTANRSPAFQLIIVALLVGLLVGGHQRLGPKGLVALVLAAILVVVAAGFIGAQRAMSARYYGPPEPGTTGPVGPRRDYAALTLIAIRGYAVVPAQNFGYVLAAIPERMSWRLGTTYLQPALTMLPGKQTTFDADLKAALGQRYSGGGTVPSMLGEAYGNFGPIGWFLVPFLVSLVVTGLYRLSAARSRPALWTLYAYAIFHVSTATISGLLVANIMPVFVYVILGLVAIVDLYRQRANEAPAGKQMLGSRAMEEQPRL
jgi:hypothetical protein